MKLQLSCHTQFVSLTTTLIVTYKARGRRNGLLLDTKQTTHLISSSPPRSSSLLRKHLHAKLTRNPSDIFVWPLKKRTLVDFSNNFNNKLFYIDMNKFNRYVLTVSSHLNLTKLKLVL